MPRCFSCLEVHSVGDLGVCVRCGSHLCDTCAGCEDSVKCLCDFGYNPPIQEKTVAGGADLDFSL